MYGGSPIRAMSAFLGTNQHPILSVNLALATVKQDRQVLPPPSTTKLTRSLLLLLQPPRIVASAWERRRHRRPFH